MARNDWTNLLNTDPRGLMADGITLASFTTAASLFPDITLPANFWVPGRTVHIRARGIWAATGTPTYTWSMKFGSVVVVTSAAITVSAITNQSWVMEATIQCRTSGTSGTLLGMGDITMGGVTGVNYLPATGSAPATATVDTTVAAALALQVAASVSNAANTVKGVVEAVLAWN